MTKKERELATVAVELTFRTEIEVYRDDDDSTPEEIAQQIYEENGDFDELLARGEKELDALRDLDQRRIPRAADLDVEIDFFEVREPAEPPDTDTEPPANQLFEFVPEFTDYPERDEMSVRMILPGPGGQPMSYETRFAKSALADGIRRLLGFDKAAEKLAQARDKTGEPPAWLDEDAALHRTDRAQTMQADHIEAGLKLVRIRTAVDAELGELEDLGDLDGAGGRRLRRVLTEIRDILTGEVKP